MDYLHTSTTINPPPPPPPDYRAELKRVYVVNVGFDLFFQVRALLGSWFGCGKSPATTVKATNNGGVDNSGVEMS